MLEEIQKIISDQLGINPNDVLPECSLEDDLGADSLDMVELFMAFSDEFDVEISDEDAENIHTVNDIIECLRENGIE